MTNTMSSELAALREKVDRLSGNIRAEKREKGSQGTSWQNHQCKDWLTYSAERSRLHAMEKELGLR